MTIRRIYKQEGFKGDCPVHLGSVLLKDEELMNDLTYDRQKLLLIVGTLVGPLILT